MEYTIGNWHVESLTTDSIATAKTPSITDLSYAADYTVTKDEPAELRLANTTGASLGTVETLRYARNRVKDVYHLMDDVPLAQRSNVTSGYSILEELTVAVKATNSVSGEEIILPMRGRMVLELPTADFITSDAVSYLLMRTISAAFATGKTDQSLVVDLARGDLDPRS